MGLYVPFKRPTIFRNMTVRENVIVAHHLRASASLWGYFLATPAARRDQRAFGDSADEILDFLELQHLRHERVSNLPHGNLARPWGRHWPCHLPPSAVIRRTICLA